MSPTVLKACLPFLPTAPQIPPTKTELELKDVFDLIKTLAAEEWKELGKALCIENVESIPSKRGITKKDEAYLREVLRRWLNGPDPSLEDLIRALKECYCEEAAKELERRFFIAGHCTCFVCVMSVHACDFCMYVFMQLGVHACAHVCCRVMCIYLDQTDKIGTPQ